MVSCTASLCQVPDIVSQNSVLYSLQKGAQWQTALTTLDTCHCSSLQTSSVTYGTVLKLCKESLHSLCMSVSAVCLFWMLDPSSVFWGECPLTMRRCFFFFTTRTFLSSGCMTQVCIDRANSGKPVSILSGLVASSFAQLAEDGMGESWVERGNFWQHDSLLRNCVTVAESYGTLAIPKHHWLPGFECGKSMCKNNAVVSLFHKRWWSVLEWSD